MGPAHQGGDPGTAGLGQLRGEVPHAPGSAGDENPPAQERPAGSQSPKGGQPGDREASRGPEADAVRISRRGVSMLWIDNVFSVRCQVTNTATSTTA